MFNFAVTGEILQPQAFACDQLHFVPFYDKLETGVEKDERSFHERISHGMGFKDSGIKILKRGIIIGGAVTRSLIGIGAAATLIYAAIRKKNRARK